MAVVVDYAPSRRACGVAARRAKQSLVGILCLTLCSAASTGREVGRSAAVADLEIARRDYVDASPELTPAQRADGRRLIARLLDQARSRGLSRAAMLVGMMRLAAVADNGHDIVYPASPSAAPGSRLPLFLIWLPDGLMVVRAGGEAADLAGAEVVAIEGRPVGDIYRRARTLFGGTESKRKLELAYAVTQSGVLQTLGLARSSTRLRITFDDGRGRKTMRLLHMVGTDQLPTPSEPQRVWLPAPMGNDQGWRTATPPGREPLYLQDGSRWFRILPVRRLDAMYVQFRSHLSEESQDIGAFASTVADAVASERPRHLIVDLRLDYGGNILTTLQLFRHLPLDVTGTTYVLVGPWTFSAGIVSAAVLKAAGGTRVKLVGAPVGDRLRFWSESGRPACLPNAQLCLTVRNGLFDLARGCAPSPHCYGDQWKANVGTLDPDIAAPTTMAAYRAGRDPGLEAIEQDLLGRPAARAHASGSLRRWE